MFVKWVCIGQAITYVRANVLTYVRSVYPLLEQPSNRLEIWNAFS